MCVCVVSCQLRVSKEQEHFLVLPNGLAYGEVTASSLVSSLLILLHSHKANLSVLWVIM